jgi:copper transporter 1
MDRQDGHGMVMSFHAGYCETVLFESWKVTSVGGLVGSMIAIFFIAVLYEGLKYSRRYILWKTCNSLKCRAVAMSAQKATGAEDTRTVQKLEEVIRKLPILSRMHGFQTILYTVQSALGHFLMLIFTMYNVWFCVALVSGTAVGYFLFGWKKSYIIELTDCCP